MFACYSAYVVYNGTWLAAGQAAEGNNCATRENACQPEVPLPWCAASPRQNTAAAPPHCETPIIIKNKITNTKNI